MIYWSQCSQEKESEQGQLCNLWGPEQNENGGPFVQNKKGKVLLKILTYKTFPWDFPGDKSG